MSTPERDGEPQWQVALDRANRIRLSRSRFRAETKSNHTTREAAEIWAGLIEHPEDEWPEWLPSTKLGYILLGLRAFGKGRMHKACARVSMSEEKTIASMTSRQRAVLVAHLRDPRVGR